MSESNHSVCRSKMEQAEFNGKVIDIYTITSADSPEFHILKSTLSQTSVVGLDAEWKPQLDGTSHPNFPYICLLQIACLSNTKNSNSVVFLLDLLKLKVDPTSIPEIHKLLKGMFESDKILKLGFRFKQDFTYLSSTFQYQFQYQLPGWDSGFDRVDPHMDIFQIYNHIRSLRQQPLSKQIMKLKDICEEILTVSLSKELQRSDWSIRPITKEQKDYAAIDAYCLIEIFNVFQAEVLDKGNLSCDVTDQLLPTSESSIKTIPMDDNLLLIVRKYSMNIVLNESDRKPKKSETKNIGQSSSAQPVFKGPLPWDCSLDGDGRPKFLCGDMVVGLARLLRVAGIDTEIAYRSPFNEDQIKPCIEDQIKEAKNEGRMLITREAKSGKHDCLNYYKLKSLSNDDQLAEVFKVFGLERNKDQMYRCTHCNNGFKRFCPLSTEEAIEAADGYSISCWCTFCRDIYERYLYIDEKGKKRIDHMWLAQIGVVW